MLLSALRGQYHEPVTNHEKTVYLQVWVATVLLIWHALHMELASFTVAFASAATPRCCCRVRPRGLTARHLSTRS